MRAIAAVADTYGAIEAFRGFTDGQWDHTDVFNLLTLVDFGITVFTGVKGSLATWRGKGGRTANGAASNGSQALQDAGETKTAVDFQNNSACFVAGTEILTPEGEVSIEDIEVGDWVIADDPTTPGEIEKRQVLQTFVREADVLVDLHVDGELISTTEEHPFWVVDQGWVEADDLRVGDLLITEDGIIIDIDWIEKREGDFEVYNFEVEDFHTYFVSDLEVLVHNANCGLRPDAERAIERLENIKENVLGDVNRQSGHNHYNAARREANGEVVAVRPDGTPFDHIGELQDAYRGLQNVRRTLEREMNVLPDTLTDRGLEVLDNRYKEVQQQISRLKGFLDSIGHSP